MLEPVHELKEQKEQKFKWQDYTVIAVSLGITLVIGFFFALTGGRQRTTKEYFLADKGYAFGYISFS